jgi:hypothetical protein
MNLGDINKRGKFFLALVLKKCSTLSHKTYLLSHKQNSHDWIDVRNYFKVKKKAASEEYLQGNVEV